MLKDLNLEGLMLSGILVISVPDRSKKSNKGKEKSSSCISETLVFCNSKLEISTSFSTDEVSCLILVFCVSSTVRCSIGSKMSGKVL